MRQLPPLKALRAFEAAGRHLSFTAAAAELHVTQAAVSQQVKLLETHLQQALFSRGGRTLSLTVAGRAYLREIGQALDQIAEATRQLAHSAEQHLLVISTLASFAGSWLLPRLSDFQRQHPDIRVRIETDNTLVDIRRSDIHGAIRYGRGQYGELHSQWLFDETIFPVCSPELWATLEHSSDIGVLERAPLIYDVDVPQEWQQWLRAAGYPERRLQPAMGFNDANLIVKAVEDHMGIALLRRELAAPGLATGRLVAPFKREVAADFAYYWVTDPTRRAYRPQQYFQRWLLLQCRRYREA